MTAGLTRIKRKRGGQKGNQNARKHGFYSSTLKPEEICRFWNIINQERVDPEMAVLRIKLQSLASHAPANQRVLRDLCRIIVKWSVKKYRLDSAESAYLKAAVLTVLEHSSGVSLARPERLLKTAGISAKTNQAEASVIETNQIKKRISLEKMIVFLVM